MMGLEFGTIVLKRTSLFIATTHWFHASTHHPDDQAHLARHLLSSPLTVLENMRVLLCHVKQVEAGDARIPGHMLVPSVVFCVASPEQAEKIWIDQGGVLVLEEVSQLVHHNAHILFPLLLLAWVDQDVDVGRSRVHLPGSCLAWQAGASLHLFASSRLILCLIPFLLLFLS